MTTFFYFKKLIQLARFRGELEKLENRILAHYETGTLTESEFRLLDGQIMSKFVKI